MRGAAPPHAHPHPLTAAALAARHAAFDPAHDDASTHFLPPSRTSPLSSADLALPFSFGGSSATLAYPPSPPSTPHPPPAPDPPLLAYNPTFLSTSSAATSTLHAPSPAKRASLPALPTPSSPRSHRVRAESSASAARAASRARAHAAGEYDDFEDGAGRAEPAAGAAGIDWAAARGAHLLAPDGARVRFDAVAAGLARHTVLVFVSPKNVEVGALVYGRVAHLLHQAGARLVFVSPWAPAQAAAFLARFERVNPFPGALLCDPDAALFAAVGFKRTALAAMLPTLHVPLRHGVRAAAAAVTHRAANRDLATTGTRGARIKTGAVVLANAKHAAEPPTVVLRAEDGTEAAAGPGCYLDVLPACGVGGAFIPDLDVPHVVARFRNMRNNAIKAAQESAREVAGSAGRRRNGLP